MTLSQMRQLLAERGVQLTKALGQNFLHDSNQLRRIVAAAALGPGDRVLEIGPGLGPLTELLLARAGEVLAIEKDARLVEVLRQRFAAQPQLKLVHDDALEFLRREPRDWSGWKLVANLPYSVASPILVELAQSERGPERMVATLQLEVAQRLLAQPGAADYGVLTLRIQLAYAPQGTFKIPATCFFPKPDVDSACVTVARRAEPLLPDAEAATFATLVKQAFSQRRKMMLKLLKQKWPGTDFLEIFERLQLAPQVRAEDVNLETFVCLTQLLAARPATQRQ